MKEEMGWHSSVGGLHGRSLRPQSCRQGEGMRETFCTHCQYLYSHCGEALALPWVRGTVGQQFICTALGLVGHCRSAVYMHSLRSGAQ